MTLLFRSTEVQQMLHKRIKNQATVFLGILFELSVDLSSKFRSFLSLSDACVALLRMIIRCTQFIAHLNRVQSAKYLKNNRYSVKSLGHYSDTDNLQSLVFNDESETDSLAWNSTVQNPRFDIVICTEVGHEKRSRY